jgi:SPP1 family holin
MKITKGTVIRGVMILIVLVNIIASKASGKELFFIDESQVTEAIEVIIAIAAIAVGYWKNNSYSKNAIAADEFLKTLNGKEDEK